MAFLSLPSSITLDSWWWRDVRYATRKPHTSHRLRACRLEGQHPFVMKVVVQPRMQKEKWSLYWKETMATKTELLDTFEAEYSDSATVSDLKADVAKRMGWQPVDQLLRLEGFEEPWELAIYLGSDMDDQSTLVECGLSDGATVTTVRKFLVAEGWKVMCNEDEDDSDSDEDDF